MSRTVVPEATVNEHGQACSSERNVRLSENAIVDAIPKAQRPDGPAKSEFRRRIHSPDERHLLALG
jgi:hypothetical protein